MYYGKMTEELERLYEKYEKEFGYEPDGVEQLEYTDDNYDQYVSDIQKSLESHKHLTELYPQID